MITHSSRTRRVLTIVAGLAAFGSLAACTGGTDTTTPTVATTSIDGSQTLPALPDDETVADPAIGMIPPAISAQSVMSEGTVKILPGSKPMVVVFGAHWCPHCNRELPPLAEHLKADTPEGVQIFFVSSAAQEGTPNYPPNSWLQKMGWPEQIAPAADDAKSVNATKWGLSGFPFFVALDKDGKVVARAAGEIGIDAFDALVAKAAG